MKILVSLIALISLLLGSVDINKADVKELVTLKGIGISKAKAIVKYREVKCFETVKELSLVRGIGNKTVTKNIDELTVSKCKK